jgi:hypothetical protein
MLHNYSPAQEPQPQLNQPEITAPALLSAKPLKEDPKDDELRKLLKARYNEGVGEVKMRHEQYKFGLGGIDDLFQAGQRLVQAGLELHDKSAEKVVLLTQYLELTKDIEKLSQTRYDAGLSQPAELCRARYQRLDAEIQLLRAKREADRDKKGD